MREHTAPVSLREESLRKEFLMQYLSAGVELLVPALNEAII